MLSNMRLAMLDLETTGASASRDEITEIAVILRDAEEQDAWQSLLRVDRDIPSFIQRLTGITPEMLVDAPSFESLAPQLMEYLEGAVLVAHNARFDAAFLKQAFRRLGFDYKPKVLCSLKLARSLYPDWPKHGLDALCSQIGYERDCRHRAMADVLAMKAFLEFAIADLGEERVTAEVHAQLKIPSLPVHITAEMLDEIPDRPGVYRFFGENDALLYVGKSIAMRSRVLSHFSAGGRQGKAMRMAQQLRRIECSETAGELGALLQESAEIKTTMPLHNRQLRRQRELCAASLQPDEDGYIGLQFLAADQPLPETEFCLFKHRKQAQQLLRDFVKSDGLCPQRLGLERGGSCFSYQLGHCAGACCGEQSPEQYNALLKKKLALRCVESWPYDGPVLIVEPSSDDSRVDWHLVDRWRYFGTFTDCRPESDDCEQRVLAAQPFDYDHYRILQSFRQRLTWQSLKP